MSKRVSSRWYIGAWVVWVLAGIVFVLNSATTRNGGSVSAVGTNSLATVAWITALIAALVMFVMWIGALIRLAQQRAWAWFAGVLISHLVLLGILGMVAYAMGGPADDREYTPEHETRPTLA